MLLLRSLAFFVGSVAATLVIGGLGIFTAPFPFNVRYRFISQWARFNLWWLKITCGLSYRVTGREHIPSGNAIILCKHQSTWETLALQAIFPPQVWVLKRELLWVPFFGWGLAMLEPISIDRRARRKSVEQIIEQGKKRLADGRWVVIFPEGTRVAPGARRRYGIGGAALAEQSGYPVVPVAHNAGEFWPRRGFIKHPGVIDIRVGPPIDSRGKSAAEINALTQAWIEGEMQRMSAPHARAEVKYRDS